MVLGSHVGEHDADLARLGRQRLLGELQLSAGVGGDRSELDPPAAGAAAEEELDADELAEEAGADDDELLLLDPPQAATPSASAATAPISESFDIRDLLFRPTVD